MDISEISRTTHSELERNGYRGRIVSAQRLSDLKEEIEVRHRAGIFDEGSAFPDWIDLSWHNCLIGCMLCQSVCPVNKRLKNWFENTESFGEEETRLLAEGASRERLPKTTTERLQRLCLLEDLDMIERNLGVLLKQHSL